MIGYSNRARKYYHKCSPWNLAWARCDAIFTDRRFPDGQEPALKKAAPHLSRCPKCWKGEK